MVPYNNRVFLLNRRPSNVIISDQTIATAVRWAKIMEKRFSTGKFDHDIASVTMTEFGLKFGDSFSHVVNFLADVWVYGRDLLEWHEAIRRGKIFSCN